MKRVREMGGGEVGSAVTKGSTRVTPSSVFSSSSFSFFLSPSSSSSFLANARLPERVRHTRNN